MKHQTYLSLTQEELAEGILTCFKNSNSHYQCALELEKIEQYGIANSHLILSGEEAIKGLVLLIRYANMPFSIDDVKPFFSSHTPKHTLARKVYWFFKHSQRIGQDIMKDIYAEMEKRPNYFAKRVDGKIQVNDDLVMDIFLMESKLRTRQVMIETLKNDKEGELKERNWWNKADYFKNRGFYVNYNNKKWDTPSDVSKEIFLESKKIVFNLISGFISINSVQMLDRIKKLTDMENSNVIELYNTKNGTKVDRIFLKEVANVDGTGMDYEIEYQGLVDDKKIFVGTCELTLGCIHFAETKDAMGIPYSAIRLVTDWIEKHLEE